MNLFEHLYYFFNVSKAKQFGTATQILYLHILWRWNCLRQPKRFRISDRELSSLTCLNQRQITTEKRRLKNLGFIDFKSSSSITVYSILDRVADKAPAPLQKRCENDGSAFISDTPNITDKNLKINCAGEVKGFDISINF